jgi:hypothetical protein
MLNPITHTHFRYVYIEMGLLGEYLWNVWPASGFKLVSPAVQHQHKFTHNLSLMHLLATKPSRKYITYLTRRLALEIRHRHVSTHFSAVTSRRQSVFMSLLKPACFGAQLLPSDKYCNVFVTLSACYSGVCTPAWEYEIRCLGRRRRDANVWRPLEACRWWMKMMKSTKLITLQITRHRQCTYNLTLRRVRVYIFDAEKQ